MYHHYIGVKWKSHNELLGGEIMIMHLNWIGGAQRGGMISSSMITEMWNAKIPGELESCG